MLAHKLSHIIKEQFISYRGIFFKLGSVEDSLWSVGHAEACQVSIREGEQSHDDDKGAVVAEDGGEFRVLDIT